VNDPNSMGHCNIFGWGCIPRVVGVAGIQSDPRRAVVGSALFKCIAKHTDRDHLLRKLFKGDVAVCHGDACLKPSIV